MNKPLRRIAIFCGLLVLALLIRDNWIQYVQADSLKKDTKNRRVAIARYATPRGDIIVDGEPITGSTKTSGDDFNDFEYKRTYKDGAMWAPSRAMPRRPSAPRSWRASRTASSPATTTGSSSAAPST